VVRRQGHVNILAIPWPCWQRVGGSSGEADPL
jgi:hypothetical protein